MKVAVGQMSVSADKDENLAKIEQLVSQAFDAGAKLIVFPEACMYRIGEPTDSLTEAAESVDGVFVSKLKKLANLHSMWIVAGMFESSVDAHRVYNTVVIIDHDGNLKDSYRKIHLYDAFGIQESDRVLAGDGATVLFQIEDITFGVMTCYDLRFPELARYLAYQGALALLLPAAWYAGPRKESHFEVLARARAIENNLYLVASMQVGNGCIGHSMIVDPMGIIQAGVADNECILVSELTKERIDDVREISPTLHNRRADIYSRWKETSQRWYEEVSD